MNSSTRRTLQAPRENSAGDGLRITTFAVGFVIARPVVPAAQTDGQTYIEIGASAKKSMGTSRTRPAPSADLHPPARSVNAYPESRKRARAHLQPLLDDGRQVLHGGFEPTRELSSIA
ncbi:hypothetical protein AURDEDRAFT_171508 [Auricularia subglabra TFB-10046 SS5]|nr:hypothetical protein AURDEDRAFT_171508 [Auricularia subglabra TFB-10046 SS5]